MQRIHNLKIDEGMMFIDHPTDIYYLLGEKVSKGVILVFPDETLFFVDSRYIDACKSVKGATVLLNEGTSVEDMIKSKNPSKILVDGKTCKFDQYNYLKRILPEAKISGHTRFQEMRVIKDKDEIQKMKVAGALNYAGYEHAMSCLREGISEKEVAWEYEKFCKERGGEALSFETIVAFGVNSSYPHYHTGETKLKKGMAVLMDCGITVDSYTSDMTRDHFFEKEANLDDYKLWKTHFDLVKESYNRAVAKIKPGEMFSNLDTEVQDYAKKMGVDKNVKHMLGHNLGLDIHEWPRVSVKFPNIEIKENMVFTIEPGLYFEGKWGIRYENTLWLSGQGVQILSGRS
ncbi:MAG: Aminopeptidase [Chlamydiia bacterium]|nr:Aminopeptidase [Chlamydiia bacterium]